MSKGKWEKVGAMLKKKDGNGYYAKIEKDVPAGTILQMQDPRERVQKLIDAGHISQDEGTERLAKIPDFVRLELILPPPKDDTNF